jgi:hypothetical protein
MNWWTYSATFHESLPADALLNAVIRTSEELHARGWRAGRLLSADREFGPGESQFPLEADMVAALAETGGGFVSALFAEDNPGFGFQTNPPGIKLSSPGNLLDAEIGMETELRAAFYWICQEFRPIFGSSEDLYQVENIWHHCGVDGWNGLLAVGALEREDIQRGRAPDILPWLTYMDGVHFAEDIEALSEIPGVTQQPIGETGVVIRAANYPWEGRFVLRADDGYSVVDSRACRVSDGRSVVPVGLDRVKVASRGLKS